MTLHSSSLRTLYPEIEPFDSGMHHVGDGHTIYWERCGTKGACKPAEHAQLDRHAALLRQDQRLVLFRVKKLIVAGNGVGLARVLENALCLVYIGLSQNCTQIFETQAIRSKRPGIGLNAHRWFLSAAD